MLGQLGFTRLTQMCKGLNMFLVPINMLNFRFSPSKKFLQFLVPIKFSIFTFGPSFNVKIYVEFIFLIIFFRKIHNIIRISPKKKLELFNKT